MKLMGTDVEINKLLLKQLAHSMGLDKYERIMRNELNENEFQRTFNSYYQVRRNNKWRESFFKFYNEAKKERYSFDRIIQELFSRTGQVEASFSSKMLATIDNSKPILDRRVLRFLNLELTGTSPKKN